MAWPMFSHVAPKEPRALRMSASTLRVYVWLEMIYADSKPAFLVTSSSSCSTLSWSPLKIWRNDAYATVRIRGWGSWESAYLSASGSLHTPESQIVPGALEVLQVLQQILYPQAGTLSNSGQLCWLKMGIPQTREAFVLLRKCGELLDDGCEFREQDV